MDCEKLSPNALKIFKRLRPFYPPDSWQKPQWKEEGIVLDNGIYDLRKQADRKRLEENKLQMVGYSMRLQAKQIMDKESSLVDLEHRHIPKSVQVYLEILLILDELDFQIETMDLVEA